MNETDDDFQLLRIDGPVIANLLELCNIPFEVTEAIEAFRRFGWRYSPAPDDPYGFQVEVLEGLHLTVAPNGVNVDCMILPFCWWPNYDVEFAESRLRHAIEKRKFGIAFKRALDMARKTIGPPLHTGRDLDDDRHQYAAWQGKHAWLILQQAAYDVQFGLEINFWLEPTNGESFTPTTPLIDWLTSRHRVR